MSESQIGDTSVIKRLPVSGIPLNTNEYSYVAVVLPASSTMTLTITTDTVVKELSLFNWAFTTFVDTDGNIDYIYPTGDALTSSQRTFVIMGWQDWYYSDSTTNRKVYKYIAYNNNAVAKTLYIYFKAFTFAYIAGASGGSSA